MEPDTWYAYFHVRGSFDPDEITRTLGVQPTQIAREGDATAAGKGQRNYSCWELHSRLGRTEEIERHLTDVLDQLDVNRDGFAQVSGRFGGTLEVVGYFQETSPGIYLKGTVVRRIAEYGLSIDCDFYSL